MEAETLAASLQRSREQIRGELFAADDGENRIAGLIPRSTVMSFLLAPGRRSLVLGALSAVMMLIGHGKEPRSGAGMKRLLWMLLGLSLRRRL